MIELVILKFRSLDARLGNGRLPAGNGGQNLSLPQKSSPNLDTAQGYFLRLASG